MQELNPNDLTKGIADEKFGSFEPDPNDPFIQRYVPTPDEIKLINDWLRAEIDAAWEDDQPQKERKLRLLNAYRGLPDGKDQILVMPLVKRAVRRNVAYAKGKILSETPIVTVKPTSNGNVKVLVEDPQYGTVPMEKSSEEVANSLEWWFDWKLRNRIAFDDVVEIAATEAKRGQTPTWLKIVHRKEKRTIKVPRFEEKGPLAVTFSSKDDVEILSGDPDQIKNVSTYSMLMPADEQDPQESRWLAELTPQTSEELRRHLYNGDYNLIPKEEWEQFIAEGLDTEQAQVEARQQAAEKRIASAPKGKHDILEVWFFRTVRMKKSISAVSDDGEPTEKSVTTYQEYSMVGHFHRKLGRLMSLIRNPFDHGLRPYVPVYDRKEPFRHTGESLAEDVLPYQKVQSQMASLEIRGKVIQTTPIFFAEPGSVAGDWITEHEVEPGDVIPRLRPEEVQAENLGSPNPLSLIPLIQFFNGEYEKNTSIGDLQLGLNVPSRTPASSIAQVLNEGQTDAQDFLERFCGSLVEALVLYVKTVQQYMRTGEVIPFDPETKALIESALESEGQQDEGQGIGDGVPMRFPMQPITDQFTFQMTAISGETQQADFEKYAAFKQIVDADGAQLAQITGPLASGQLPPTITQLLVQQVTRSQMLMERMGKLIFKDGEAMAISPNLIKAIVQEQQMQQQMQQMAAQNGAMNAQGAGPDGQPPAAQPAEGGLGGPVPQPGVSPDANGDQIPPPPPPIPTAAGPGIGPS